MLSASPTRLRQVNSQDTVKDWRSPGTLSDGASSALVELLPTPTILRREQALAELSPGSAARTRTLSEESIHDSADDPKSDHSFVCSLQQDLLWVFSEWSVRADGSVDPCHITMAQAEEWAIFVHAALTEANRAFHDMAHVFQICAGASPLQVISALFRDVISYWVLDHGQESESTKRYLQNVFKEEGSTVLSDAVWEEPREACIAYIFGYEKGSANNRTSRLDIFLSCLLASRLLRSVLSVPHVLQLAICLEATIPFRGPTLDASYARLRTANELYNQGESSFLDEQMTLVIQQAADLHNRYVGNMASTNLAEFLGHTWQLLPEKHDALRHHSLYRLNDYYIAIQSMATMTNTYDPMKIFCTFSDIPTEKEVTKYRDQLQKNLGVCQTYMQARLLSVAVVEAIATFCGGTDAPKSFFFGDLPKFHQQATLLGDGLFDERETIVTDANSDALYSLLLTGEGMSDVTFDASRAPLAAFLYLHLSPSGIRSALERVGEIPMTEERASAVLKSIPLNIVERVATEVGRVAVSRRRLIQRFLEQLKAER